MKKEFIKDVTIYESPILVQLDVVSEGVLCASGTEKLDENEGFWA